MRIIADFGLSIAGMRGRNSDIGLSTGGTRRLISDLWCGCIPTAIVIVGLSALLLITAGNATAQNANLGTAGAQFLKIPVGGRASAMGGAFISNANDASSVFWNPSGIVDVQSTGLLFAHSEWWATVQLNHAAFVQTMADVGTIALSFTSLSMDRMDVTTEDQPEGTGETFDAGDIMIGLSFARKLTEDFSVGVTAKYVQQRIWNEKAGGLAFDVGSRYRIGFRDLTIGMSMTNFGGDLSYEGTDLSVDYVVNPNNATTRMAPAHLAPEDVPLPLHFQVGVSISPYVSDDFSALVALDVAHPNDNAEHVNAGIELTILKQLYLRGGYRFGYDIDRAAFGAGVAAPVGGVNLTFDYSYCMYDILPNVSRFSVGMTF